MASRNVGVTSYFHSKFAVMSLFASVSGCTGNIAGIHLQNAHYFKAVRAVGASPKTMRAAEAER